MQDISLCDNKTQRYKQKLYNIHNRCYQVAQLSQSVRAQGGLVMTKSERLELGDNIYGHHRSIFNHCDVIDHQMAIEFGEKQIAK